ncbi:hypothetical protein N9B82_01475 [Saprospiraceae bacterium]|nr:hypothetical protein [Saprospiraceae bacterium]
MIRSENIQETKVGILGMGAIGSVISTLLCDSIRSSTSFYSRTERNFISVNGPTGSSRLMAKVSDNPAEKYHLDWLIICLKFHQYPDASDIIKSLINPQTKIVQIGNGIGLKSRLNDIVERNPILECMIDCPTEERKPYEYQQLSKAVIQLSKGALADDFTSLFNQNSIKFNLVNDFLTANWKKTIESSMLGGLMVSINGTVKDIKEQNLIDTFRKGVVEAMKVARADGAKIPDDFPIELLAKLQQYSPDKGSSMLTDFRKKKTLEIGAKNGLITSFGKKFGIPTPINNLLVATMHRKQASYETER